MIMNNSLLLIEGNLDWYMPCDIDDEVTRISDLITLTHKENIINVVSIVRILLFLYINL